MVRRVEGSKPQPMSRIETKSVERAKSSITSAADEVARHAGGFDAAKKRPLSLSGRFKASPLQPGATKADLQAFIAEHRVVAQAGGAGGAKAKAKHPLEGLTLLNTNAAGERVTAKKVLGASDGYNTRYEAIAAARMTGSDTAFVVEKDGRWFAVEADKPIGKGNATSSENGLQHVEGLPPYDEQRIASLRSELQTAIDAGDAKQINAKRLELASELFGVPESEIALIRSSGDRKEGKINVIDLPAGTSGQHGPEQDQGEEFTPGKKTAIEIDHEALMGTGNDPLGVLFHESSHQRDYELAQKWVSVWEKESGKKFVPSENGDPRFTAWLDKRVADTKKKPVLSRADMMVVTDATRRGVNGNTEARAYLGSFIGALQAGNPKAAKDQLLTWVKGQPGRIPSPSLQLENAMFRELEKAYRAMPKDQRDAFDAALKEAQSVKGSAMKRFDHSTALKLEG